MFLGSDVSRTMVVLGPGVNQKTVIISGILTSPLLLRKEAAYWQYMTEIGHVRTCLDLMCVCIYTTVTHISERLGTGERIETVEAAEATEAAEAAKLG